MPTQALAREADDAQALGESRAVVEQVEYPARLIDEAGRPEPERLMPLHRTITGSLGGN